MNALDDVRTKKERRRALEAAARKVACPRCGAQPGEPCMANEVGEPAASVHAIRIRLGSYRPVSS